MAMIVNAPATIHVPDVVPMLTKLSLVVSDYNKGLLPPAQVYHRVQPQVELAKDSEEEEGDDINRYVQWLTAHSPVVELNMHHVIIPTNQPCSVANFKVQRSRVKAETLRRTLRSDLKRGRRADIPTLHDPSTWKKFLNSGQPVSILSEGAIHRQELAAVRVKGVMKDELPSDRFQCTSVIAEVLFEKKHGKAAARMNRVRKCSLLPLSPIAEYAPKPFGMSEENLQRIAMNFVARMHSRIHYRDKHKDVLARDGIVVIDEGGYLMERVGIPLFDHANDPNKEVIVESATTLGLDYIGASASDLETRPTWCEEQVWDGLALSERAEMLNGYAHGSDTEATTPQSRPEEVYSVKELVDTGDVFDGGELSTWDFITKGGVKYHVMPDVAPPLSYSIVLTHRGLHGRKLRRRSSGHGFSGLDLHVAITPFKGGGDTEYSQWLKRHDAHNNVWHGEARLLGMESEWDCNKEPDNTRLQAWLGHEHLRDRAKLTQAKREVYAVATGVRVRCPSLASVIVTGTSEVYVPIVHAQVDGLMLAQSIADSGTRRMAQRYMNTITMPVVPQGYEESEGGVYVPSEGSLEVSNKILETQDMAVLFDYAKALVFEIESVVTGEFTASGTHLASLKLELLRVNEVIRALRGESSMAVIAVDTPVIITPEREGLWRSLAKRCDAVLNDMLGITV